MKNFKIIFVFIIIVILVLFFFGYFKNKKLNNAGILDIDIVNTPMNEYFSNYVDLKKYIGSVETKTFLGLLNVSESLELDYGYFNSNEDTSNYKIVGYVLDEDGKMLEVSDIYMLSGGYGYILLSGANEKSDIMYELTLKGTDVFNIDTKLTAKVHHEGLKDVSFEKKEDSAGKSYNIMSVIYNDDTIELYEGATVFNRY